MPARKDALGVTIPCGDCGGRTEVIESRMASEGTAIRRRRRCVSCGTRETTYEIPAELLEQVILTRTPKLDSLKAACDHCGVQVVELHCKLVCPNCGAKRDCSDP